METAVISFWMVMTLGRLPPHGIPVHLEFTSGGKRTTLDINKES